MNLIERLSLLRQSDLDDLIYGAHPTIACRLPTQIAIVGTSAIGESILLTCAARGIKVIGVFDDSPQRQGHLIHGHLIRPVSDLKSVDKDVPVVLATHRLRSISLKLRSYQFTRIWPFPLLAYQWSDVFTCHTFYENLQQSIVDNADQLKWLSSVLNDQLSVDTLEAIVNFRLTLDVSELESVIAPRAYFAEDLISLSSTETFIDGGAFTGDTVREFVSYCRGSYNRIIAFEPSPGSYSKLVENVGSLGDIVCKQTCLYSQDTTLNFSSTDNRDSMIDESSYHSLTAECIDNLPEAPEITFIKLNIEGAEESAIYGARDTIAKISPKLAIAVYHKPNDLWTIPRMIKDIRHDYVLSLRHHDGGIVESVLYGNV